jgi:hypothetical protein
MASKSYKFFLAPRLVLFNCVLLCCFTEARSQHDSLVLNNGDIIVGEIKSMEKGVVIIETGYSKNDFSVEWSGIKEIYSKAIFMVTLSDGRKINGSLQSTEEGKKVLITGSDEKKIEAALNDIVFLKGIKSDFWSRLSASIDAGFSLSKANNLQQFTVNSSIGYTADKWMLDFYYTMVNSSQDSVESTKRTDAGLNYKYSLKRHWFFASSLNFLSNTEQALKLRSMGKVGIGNYLVHTNRSYWGLSAGFSYNNESFTNGTASRNSLEAYAGTELNLFDIGDLSLYTSLYAYPGLTESGRLRTDFKIDTKYDLPRDFYIKLGWTLNYDNRPAIEGKETDYVFFFTVGWEL